MTQKSQVSADLLAAAEAHVNDIFERRPAMAKLWRDMNQTSAISRVSGLVKLETNFDWIVAALLLIADGEQRIPRESK